MNEKTSHDKEQTENNELVNLFVKAIKQQEQDNKLKIIYWLTLVREILNNDNLTRLQKFQQIYEIVDTGSVFNMIKEWLTKTVHDLPLPIKVALPATLIAVPFIGGQGAGIAALGSAIGVPILLIIFLGSAGITSIIEAFVSKPEAQDYMSIVLAMIARDEVLRRVRQQLRAAMVTEPEKPHKFDMPRNTQALQEHLLKMEPYDFERHVMSFFQQAGMLAWVTKQSNDAGVDGFARHTHGLILVQCKRYGPTNFIGRPAIQQLKGVIEENNAWRGYIVTTSKFTQNAIESAALNDKIALVDIDVLVSWHQKGFSLDVTKELNPFEYKPASFLDELKKGLTKKKIEEIEQLEQARAKGFLSDDDFEKSVEKIILS